MGGVDPAVADQGDQFFATMKSWLLDNIVPGLVGLILVVSMCLLMLRAARKAAEQA
jgi:mannose/fructose/N-acetylgalactosamine-specific phosphotransferase system component IID